MVHVGEQQAAIGFLGLGARLKNQFTRTRGERTRLVALCRGKIHAAEVQVKTITEQLERDVPAEDGGTPDDDVDENIRY